MVELQRPDIRVLIRILGALAERGPRIRPTQLQLWARINYTQLGRYIAVLEARGLIRVVRDERTHERWIEITEKGLQAYGFLMRGIHDLVVATSRK